MPAAIDLNNSGSCVKRTFAVHKIRRADHARLDEFQRPPDGARRVMKTREQREIGIMDERRVQRDGRAGRAAAEKIHRAAFAHELHGGFPRFGPAHRFNHRVEMCLRCRADFRDQFPPSPMSIVWFAPRRCAASNRAARRPATVTSQPRFLASAANIKPIGPAPMTSTCWPARNFVSSTPCTTHASGSVSAASAKSVSGLQPQQILLDEPRGNDDGFRVGAVEEQQIVAEVFLPVAAMETFAARRGIGRDHAVAGLPSRFRTSLAQFRNDAREFMAKDGGRHDHLRMIAALENLQVRAAGERGLDADARFARFQSGRRDFFNLNVFLPVEDGGFHKHSL